MQKVSPENLLSSRERSKEAGCVLADTPLVTIWKGSGMYYCFLLEDKVPAADPLYIQGVYARRLGCCCVASLKQQAAFDSRGSPIDLSDKKVILRTTCENVAQGLKLLERLGAVSIETETDIAQIESWYALNLTHRRVLETSVDDLLRLDSTNWLCQFISERDFVFIKSKRKGFCGVVRSSRILHPDLELKQYLQNEQAKYGAQLLVSEYQRIKVDSMGKRESRHFIFNGIVANSSRAVHSVRHTVPKSHMENAHEVASRIATLPNFPSNYVLDIGDFILDSGETDTDIIELNPLTTSMCYVNNSVFYTVLPEIEKLHEQYMFGPEHCYDALINPNKYHYDRVTNRVYSFTSENRRDFL